MSEVLTYEHPKVGTQSAPSGSPLALALAAEADWELVEGDEPVAADESKPSDEGSRKLLAEHEAEVAAQAEIEAELPDSE